MLIAPLQAKIRHRRLLIVPHCELHYVPFAALHDAKRNRYLIAGPPAVLSTLWEIDDARRRR